MTRRRKEPKKGLGADGLSNYGRKLEERVNFTKPQEQTKHLLHKPQKKDSTPQEETRFPSAGISTYTSYLANSRNGSIVIIRPRSEFNSIYSLVIRAYNGQPLYTVNKRQGKDEETWKARQNNFKKLYDNPWIENTRSAQRELYAIEQTIQAKRSSIEKYLDIKFT